MFGIFYLIANTIGTVISGANAAKENYDAMRRGYEKQRQGKNRAGIYTDRLGATRLLSNGKRVSFDNLYCAEAAGRDCYMYDDHGRPIRNMSEEIRQERLYEAKANPDPRRTVIEWKKGISDSKTRVKGNPLYAGHTYKDLDNGKIYVCRSFSFPTEFKQRGHGTYYMDVDTGLLVREADSQIEDRKNHHYDISQEVSQQFIDYFNEKQKNEGYQFKSNIPRIEGWDTTESEYTYRDRMGDYYCNNRDTIDVPTK
jgi:hypothetical protein